jgi:N-acetylglucosaminyl-diphospho-decaprenol L-rhamnosyltransferase
VEQTVNVPDVTAVIVHYETPQFLAKCLEALAASVGVDVETIVVDNATRGFDANEVRAIVPGATVIENHKNVGFAVASNQGLRVAQGRYLLLLNPDTTVEPDTLSKMIEYMDARPDVGCSTARLARPDGTLDLACRRSFPTPATSFYRLSMLSKAFPRSQRFGRYNLTYLDEHTEAEIDAPCGAFMLVRREAVDQIGLLDERYFMYGEDLDWAYRMKQAGWRIMYAPISTVTHVKRAASSQRRVSTVHAFYDAMRIFYRRHYENEYPRWVSWLVYRGIDLRQTAELASIRLHGSQGSTAS